MKKPFKNLTLLLLLITITSVSFGQKLYGIVQSGDIYVVENCDTTKIVNLNTLYSDLGVQGPYYDDKVFEVLDDDNILFLGMPNSYYRDSIYLYRYNIPTQTTHREMLIQGRSTDAVGSSISYTQTNFIKFPDGSFLVTGCVRTSSGYEIYSYKISDDLSTKTTLAFYSFSSRKILSITEFGTRLGILYRNSAGNFLTVFNTVTQLFVASGPVHPSGYIIGMCKMDSNNVILCERSFSGQKIYLTKYRFSDFNYQVIDSIESTSPDWVKFNNGNAYSFGFNYIGDGKISIISNQGGSEAIGTISIYDISTKTTTVVKNFTSVSERIPDYSYNIYNIGNELYTFSHKATVDELSTTIQECQSFVPYHYLKCPECVQYQNNLSVETTSNLEFSIYPNPANTSFTVSIAPIGAELSVTDLTGKVVYSSAVNDTHMTIDISRLSMGVYIIEVSNSEKKYIERMVKR